MLPIPRHLCMQNSSFNTRLLGHSLIKTSTMRSMMRFLLYIIFACSLRAAVATVELLKVQGNYTREVQSIQHHSKTRELVIELKLSRRCVKPTFWIRISGAALYILDLLQAKTDKLVYGYPKLRDEGKYFIEVIALMCNKFEPDNFVNTCLEKVEDGANVVASPYNFSVLANEVSGEKRPRWVLNNTNNASLLPTRYQKTNCATEQFAWCSTNSSQLQQYGLYNWVDKPSYNQTLRDVLKSSTKPSKNATINVCMMGDSHAHMLKLYGARLKLPTIQFKYIPSSFPHEFNITTIATNRCSYAIVTYGQWPASSMTNGQPYTQTKYQEEMRRVMTLLQKYDRNRTQVFVRSENYTPLMARQTTCPPTDYRYPLVIDMYNNVLKQLSKELGVEYIDTNHIMGPMWDSAQDWYHPVGKVAIAEVEWILWHILQSSLRRKQGVVLHATE